MLIERNSAWYEIHADASTHSDTAIRIEHKDGEFTVTINLGTAVIVVACSVDNLDEVLAMVCG